jgi:hypothetical protein
MLNIIDAIKVHIIVEVLKLIYDITIIKIITDIIQDRQIKNCFLFIKIIPPYKKGGT